MKASALENTLTTASELTAKTGVSAGRVKASLKDVPVAKFTRRIRYFQLGPALRAILHQPETAAELQNRLRADLIEHRLKQMKAETLDREAVLKVWPAKLRRMIPALEGSDLLTEKDRRRLINHVNMEIERVPIEVESCQFPESDDFDSEERHDNADTESG